MIDDTASRHQRLAAANIEQGSGAESVYLTGDTATFSPAGRVFQRVPSALAPTRAAARCDKSGILAVHAVGKHLTIVQRQNGGGREALSRRQTHRPTAQSWAL